MRHNITMGTFKKFALLFSLVLPCLLSQRVDARVLTIKSSIQVTQEGSIADEKTTFSVISFNLANTKGKIACSRIITKPYEVNFCAPKDNVEANSSANSSEIEKYNVTIAGFMINIDSDLPLLGDILLKKNPMMIYSDSVFVSKSDGKYFPLIGLDNSDDLYNTEKMKLIIDKLKKNPD